MPVREVMLASGLSVDIWINGADTIGLRAQKNVVSH
jgi:hypothetical protein